MTATREALSAEARSPLPLRSMQGPLGGRDYPSRPHHAPMVAHRRLPLGSSRGLWPRARRALPHRLLPHLRGEGILGGDRARGHGRSLGRLSRQPSGQSGRLVPFVVEVSEDGRAWREDPRDDKVRDEYRLTFAPGKAKHVRVRCQPKERTFLHLRKFCVFGKKLY